MSLKTAGNGREPLTGAEVRALWHAERRAMRLYAVAVTLLAAALGIVHVVSGAPEVRYLVTLVALGLILAAFVMQFSIRCPRCRARLATQTMLLLPDRCKSCGVEIAHPPSLDAELDV